jgi:hypothetical protein
MTLSSVWARQLALAATRIRSARPSAPD